MGLMPLGEAQARLEQCVWEAREGITALREELAALATGWGLDGMPDGELPARLEQTLIEQQQRCQRLDTVLAQMGSRVGTQIARVEQRQLRARPSVLGLGEAEQGRIARLPQGVTITYEWQHRRCGKRTCQVCQRGPGHGPYCYAYWRECSGKLRSRYIGKAVVSKRPALALAGGGT